MVALAKIAAIVVTGHDEKYVKTLVWEYELKRELSEGRSSWEDNVESTLKEEYQNKNLIY
jgi:hypothetical protein